MLHEIWSMIQLYAYNSVFRNAFEIFFTICRALTELIINLNLLSFLSQFTICSFHLSYISLLADIFLITLFISSCFF